MAISPGTRLGPYEITVQLGKGGMGEVYRATDTRLGRTVAVKVLPAHVASDDDSKARFEREARTLSSLNHRHICAIYDVGRQDGIDFLVMEYLEGETLAQRLLKGALPLDEALKTAIEISDALDKAHRQGIVHRDLKPGNVMLTESGAKLLDFGLAQVAGAGALTQTGTRLGTVAYMSPEQAQGRQSDARSDIWSLGVVLYEMLSGEQPFRAEHPMAVLAAVVHSQPSPLPGSCAVLPPDLDGLVRKALAKPVADRYQTATDVLSELRRIQRVTEERMAATHTAMDTGTRSLPSIAVLPFSDMSASKDQDYFCEGMAEEIINVLTRIETLRVAARTSTFQFKGRTLDISEIGRRLNVGAVLEGSIRTSGNRLRITAQLVNVADGYHLWSERYDRHMEDVFDIQDDVSRAIVEALKVKWIGAGEAPQVERHTDNVEAYHSYLQGRYYWHRRDKGGFQQAVTSFERAVRHDPSYAPAHAGLAETYCYFGFLGFLPPKVALPKARGSADKALRLSPGFAGAHTARALVYFFEWDWLAAERAFREALALQPEHAMSHGWLGWLLNCMGRTEEAAVETTRAEELDPLAPYVHATASTSCWFGRQYARAIGAGERALSLEPTSVTALVGMGLSCTQVGRHEEAAARLERAVELASRAPMQLAFLGHAYGSAGRREEAHRIAGELQEQMGVKYVDPALVALVRVALDEVEPALDLLESAYHERSVLLHAGRNGPLFDPLRSESRWKALFRAMEASSESS